MHNKDPIVLLICPGAQIKSQIQEIIFNTDVSVRLYYYSDVDIDIDWLLSSFEQAAVVIFDIDNSSVDVRRLTSYLISYSKTYWLTNGDSRLYNKISLNQVYDAHWFKEKINIGKI